MTEEEKNQLFKEIFKRFNYGLYVLGGANSDAEDLIICSWVMQSSYNQGEVVINVDESRPIYSMIRESGKFTVSVLGIDNINEASICALSRDERKNSLAYFECNFSNSIKMKSGVLLVGTPAGGEILSDGDSLTLHEFNKLLG